MFTFDDGVMDGTPVEPVEETTEETETTPEADGSMEEPAAESAPAEDEEAAA